MMWLYIVSLLVISTTVKGDCPNLWVSFEGGCYFLFEDSEEWPQANTVCGLHSAYLVTLETANENAFAKNYARTKQVHSSNVWIGANDMMTSNQFRWTEGDKKVTFTDWARGEPNNSNGGENCVQLDRSHSYQWNDALCHNRNHFICELRKGPVIGK
ncbi:C-type lectin-like [Haliotis rubra]|uniref:C-type lectin-like n=1 Tax=Haliotis rubra TaxID=36100 RepID=UPI001EE57605|nr:C-type lectin-like [Haliotis rubra]